MIPDSLNMSGTLNDGLVEEKHAARLMSDRTLYMSFTKLPRQAEVRRD